MLALKLELVLHAGECWPVHRKETRVEALDPLGGVVVWSTSREEGSLEDLKMAASRMRLDHRDLHAEEAAGMEANDQAPRRSEVLDPFVLVEPSRTYNGFK